MAEPAPGAMDQADVAAPPVPAEEPVESTPDPEVEASEEPTEAPDEEPQAQDAEEDFDVEGERYVPVAAIAKQREKNRKLQKELDDMRAQAEQARQQAEQQQRQPTLTDEDRYRLFLLQQQQYEANTRQPTLEEAIPQDQALQYARRMNWYDQNGNWDLSRAREAIYEQQSLVEQAADRIVRERMAPIQQQQQAAASNQYKQRFINARNGEQPLFDAKVVDEVWKRVGADQTSTPQGAYWAAAAAYGHQLLSQMTAAQKQQAVKTTATPPPVPRERAGGTGANYVKLDETDRAIAQEMGMSEKEYREMASSMPKGWGKGR